MQIIHTYPSTPHLDKVYAELTVEEIEEVKAICERLQNIFLGDSYTIAQAISIGSRSDLTITINGAMQNGARTDSYIF